LGQRELVRLERGMKQKIDSLVEYGVEVLLEASPSDAGGRTAAAGFNAGCLLCEFGVERVAAPGGGAAGAPGLAVE
jgi:hypothetical protein